MIGVPRWYIEERDDARYVPLDNHCCCCWPARLLLFAIVGRTRDSVWPEAEDKTFHDEKWLVVIELRADIGFPSVLVGHHRMIWDMVAFRKWIASRR